MSRELETVTNEILCGEGLDLLKRLNPAEQRAAWELLKEFRDQNKSPTLDKLWQLDFDKQPPTIQEFLDSPEYFQHVGKDLFPRWREEVELAADPSNNIHEFIMRGCIGAGKTFVGAIIASYDLCLLLHLKNPQEFLTCGPTEIFVALVSTDLKQLQRNLWGFTLNMMKGSPFFRRNSNLREELEYNSLVVKFPKKIVLVGGSLPNHILGLNLFCGIMDETNYRRQRDPQQEALGFYLKMRSRVDNRFLRRTRRGRVVLISSEGDDKSFLNKHCEHLKQQEEKDYHICQFSEWEIRGHTLPLDGTFFGIDVGDQLRPPKILEADETPRTGATVIQVPTYYRTAAKRGLIDFLKDIAGVVPGRANRYFYNVSALIDSFVLENPFPLDVVELALDTEYDLTDYLDEHRLLLKVLGELRPLHSPNAYRFLHVDLAKNRDYAGLSMVHTSDYAKGGSPVVSQDFAIGMCASKEKPIDFDKIIEFIQWLRDTAHFAIHTVSYDSWQSLHSINILEKRGFKVLARSVDRMSNAAGKKTPVQREYDIFRTMLGESRVQLVKNARMKTEGVEMLNIDGKPDHPEIGSKDLLDASVGSVGNLVDALGETQNAGGDNFKLSGIAPRVPVELQKQLINPRQLWGDRAAIEAREDTFVNP